MMKNNRLPQRNVFISIALFLLVITIFRLIWITTITISDPIQTEDGVFHLESLSFTDHEITTLNGNWFFYPGQFLMPDATNDPSVIERKVIPVPNDWGSSLTNDESRSTYGYGTYHLQLVLPESRTQTYGLRVPDIHTSASLYINGQLVGESGRPSASPDEYEPERLPHTVTFTTETEYVDIVIHVANYDNHRYGGIVQPIEFGTDEAIMKRTFISATMQLITSALFLFHALYILILLLMRVDKKELNYLFMLLLSTSIAILLDNDRLLLHVVPLNYEWAIKLTQLAYVSTAFFSVLFIKSLFSIHEKTLTYRWLIRLFSCFYIVFLLFPIQYSGYLNLTMALFISMSFVYVLYMIWQLLVTENPRAVFLLMSILAMTSSMLWPVIESIRGLNVGFYPFDMIIALIGFASFLFKYYIDMSHQNAELAMQLQKEDKQKDQFLANTSHELRNPLHSIINITQSVIDHDNVQLDQQNRKRLETVMTVGQHMALTLNDLLDITLLKERRVKLILKEVDMLAVASSVMDMLHYLVEGKDVSFTLHLPRTLPNVYADENRLTQILFNLLHNAVKHTNEGEIIIGANVENDLLEIFVSDTGIGMSEEAQQRIFSPYTQNVSEDEGYESEHGVGLGLTICKELVELHGGSLSVHSEIGVGSTFSFTIPPYQQTNEANTAAFEYAATVEPKTGHLDGIYKQSDFRKISQAIPVRKDAKILVVDDDPLNVQILYDLLSSDYKVIKSTNGEDALTHIQSSDLDLVISDVIMPGMSGYTLARKIREHFSLSELPILLLTARDQTIDLYTGFLSGANDYLMKPIDALELKVRVHALITLKRSISDKLDMEAAWLQAQIKPHFIFNTLNTIISLRYIDIDQMTELLREFSKYLRISFQATNTDSTVPLRDEIALVRSYLFIEKVRFDDRLHIVWDVDDTISIHVPPVSIQTIVENAVRHGVLSRVIGGTVTIRIKECSDYVSIQIIDDGFGMDEAKVQEILNNQSNKHSGIGLINTRKRLRRLYDEEIRIKSIPGRGTKISFNIPKKRDHEER